MGPSPVVYLHLRDVDDDSWTITPMAKSVATYLILIALAYQSRSPLPHPPRGHLPKPSTRWRAYRPPHTSIDNALSDCLTDIRTVSVGDSPRVIHIAQVQLCK